MVVAVAVVGHGDGCVALLLGHAQLGDQAVLERCLGAGQRHTILRPPRAGKAGERDWVMISPEELTPIMRAAVAAVPDSASCSCQATWVGNEEKLPAWYREMR